MASATDLCAGCKGIREIVHTEEGTGRGFCKPCTAALPLPPEQLAMYFLAITVPFAVGDRVEARTAGTLLDGVGMVQEVSTDVLKGGTPVYPSFRVAIDEKAYDEAPDEAWYTEICLKKVAA